MVAVGDDDFFKITSDGHDVVGERSFDEIMMSSIASPTSVDNDDFSEIVSHDNNESKWFPSIAVDNDGNLHVVWSEIFLDGDIKSNIYYRMKSGDSWMPIEEISTGIELWLVNPSMALDSSGNVHVAWGSNKNESGSGTDINVFYKVRTNGEWTSKELVSTESNADSNRPSLTVDRHDNVHISWTDASDIPGTENTVSMFYKVRTASGWTPTKVIQSDAGSECEISRVVVDNNGVVHITWIELVVEDSVQQIKHRAWQGNAWGDVQTVHQSPIDISVFTGLRKGLESDGRLHLIWSEHDYVDNPTTQNYHSMKEDGVWSKPELIPLGIYDSSPAISMDKDDRLHVVTAAYPLDYDHEIHPWPETINIGYITYHQGSWSEYRFVDPERQVDQSVNSIIIDSDRSVHVVWLDLLPDSIDIRYAIIGNSELYAESASGETAVGVLVVFIAGLFVISMIVMRMRR